MDQQFEDVIYEKKEGVAWVTINRPSRLNAFTMQTVDELETAFTDASNDPTVGVVVLTGAGDRAFCTGGDQQVRGKGGYGRRKLMREYHEFVRACPKPVIAMVNGYAIGGGHVLAFCCDLTIAADTAKFGQVGPKVGSFDPGFGTSLLARIVGEKKAREIWFMCRQYTAEEAREMGLVNKVVPAAKLKEETEAWCNELLQKSPMALAFLKQAFNADTDHLIGMTNFGMRALHLYYETEEAMEGRNAFVEKRPADWGKFRR